MAQLLALDIPASHGILDGLLRLPDIPTGALETPRMAAVVCHPHPQFGGTMHNKVVFRVAQALVDLGMPALRFNFRGVGRSTGAWDEGRGEADDVRAALDALAGRYPGVPLLLAGFSFGAWVGLPVGCADARVTHLVGAGVPVSLLSTDALERCVKPKLIVQGALDQYGPQPALEAWYARLPGPKRLTIVPDADHFFTHQQTELYEAIVAGVREITGS
ncbi:MAG TPA: alpha/beta family hydrolase [Ktedonobacterales bacterium]|nr:alpha/beta family hydrolase [Ktedonobacterales bacterium]